MDCSTVSWYGYGAGMGKFINITKNGLALQPSARAWILSQRTVRNGMQPMFVTKKYQVYFIDFIDLIIVLYYSMRMQEMML